MKMKKTGPGNPNFYHIFRRGDKVLYTRNDENWEEGVYMDTGRDIITRRIGPLKKNAETEILVVQSKDKKHYHRVRRSQVIPQDWSRYT